MITNAKEGEKVGVVHRIENARHIARAGWAITGKHGVIKLDAIVETTRGACLFERAKKTIPADVTGIVEVDGSEGAVKQYMVKV